MNASLVLQAKTGATQPGSTHVLPPKVADNPSFAEVPSIVAETLRAPGQPLDTATRAFMEPRFDHDFSRVRIHTDARAAKSALSVSALAYTVGNEIAFAGGQYAPHNEAGQRLLAHELAHVVQQADQKPNSDQAIHIGSRTDAAERDADHSARAALKGLPVLNARYRARVLRRQEFHIATLEEYDRMVPAEDEGTQRRQEELLNAFENHEYLRFFELLDAMPLPARHAILNNTEIMRTFQNALPARIYWRVQITLRFGNDLPFPVVRLRALLYGQHAQEIITLLRTFPELTDESRVPGVAFLLASIYEGTPDYEAVVDAATQPVWSVGTHTGWAEEAHYETDAATGQTVLTRFTNRIAYDVVRTALELRVVVRIRFVQPADDRGPNSTPSQINYYLPESKLSEWRSGIEGIWNNRYVAANGTNRLRVIFQPYFDNTAPNPHHQVVLFDHPTNHRSNELHWWIGEDGRAIAHEFGHMLGNPDEYNLPGQIAEYSTPVCYPGGGGCITLSPQDELRNSVEGLTRVEAPATAQGHDLPTIMGNGTTVEERHVWPILEWFNANLRPPQEAPYHLETA